MKPTLPILCLAISVLAAGAGAAEPKKKAKAAPQPSAYAREVAALTAVRPDKGVFNRLRTLYAASEEYDPYGNGTRDLESAMWASMEGDDLEKTAEGAMGVLAKNFTHQEAHQVLDFAYRKLRKPALSNYHRFMAMGLLDSIFESGDGKSADTAFRIVQMSEEKAILRVLGVNQTSQALVEHKGKRYDVLQVKEPESGQELELYFEVEGIMSWMQKRLSDGTKEKKGK